MASSSSSNSCLRRLSCRVKIPDDNRCLSFDLRFVFEVSALWNGTKWELENLENVTRTATFGVNGLFGWVYEIIGFRFGLSILRLRFSF
ncbi:hypothetical protein Droror1_Dr00013214 [Drosera rotundifolia]